MPASAVTETVHVSVPEALEHPEEEDERFPIVGAVELGALPFTDVSEIATDWAPEGATKFGCRVAGCDCAAGTVIVKATDAFCAEGEACGATNGVAPPLHAASDAARRTALPMDVCLFKSTPRLAG